MTAFLSSYSQVIYRSAVHVRQCLYCTIATNDTESLNCDFRVVKVAFVGPPNAGKSTLINSLAGRRVCAISSKVHTTRRHLRAVSVEGNTQMIFLDTAGLVTADEMQKHKLSRSFMCDAEAALLQADVMGVVHDTANHWTREKIDPKSLRLLQLYQNKPAILIMNKVDAVKSKRKLLDLVKILTNDSLKSSKDVPSERRYQQSELSVKHFIKQERGWSYFSEVFMVSALTGSGVADIKDYLLQQAQRKPWVFKDTQFTDEPMEQIMIQAVQAKLLEHLPQEVPYNLSVAMEYLKVGRAGNISAVLLVKCPAPRIEKLVMGSKGGRIKLIAQETEQDLRNTFLEEVSLKLVVTGKT
ncbi:GTPase Era, mitochondrial [Anabrus simplex]|uniref:GTPase Era, mitochondrial n=1 Tax=Anabrus simplex TaxID=316456 RepID=UPI0035A2FDA8